MGEGWGGGGGMLRRNAQRCGSAAVRRRGGAAACAEVPACTYDERWSRVKQEEPKSITLIKDRVGVRVRVRVSEAEGAEVGHLD